MSAATTPALTKQANAAPNGTSMIAAVARQTGVSPFRQFLEMYRLKGGQTLLTAREYFDYQVYRPDLSLAQKREFVGEKGSFKLNLRLAPPSLTNMRSFLADKLALTGLMAQLGLPTTRIQAAFSPDRGFGTLTTLRNKADVIAFLRSGAKFPLFGKPARGAQALGSVRINGVDGDQVQLGNGQMVPLDQLATEIAANTEYGYIFQDVVEQHPEVSALTGSTAVSTVRVVTVVDGDRPRALYTLWKIAGGAAMSDNIWQKGNMIALVDPATGTLQQVRRGTGPTAEWIETSPANGKALKGATLPCWQSVTDLAVAAHSVFPVNGILGWDIAIGPDGARLIECNENTGHGLYQTASGRGILNADFQPVFARIVARNAAFLAAFDKKKAAYQKSKSAF